jgi:predicted SAM-dependent methyltransferase
VLSSDVLEHMPELYRAHSEIYRVLKPGGRHIFTVPYGEAMIRDQVRASLVDGKVVIAWKRSIRATRSARVKGKGFWCGRLRA